MKRLVEWLHGIKADKFLHFIGGLVAVQLAFALLRHVCPLWPCAALSLWASACVAAAKELLDWAGSGVASWKDFWTTVAGAVAGLSIMLLP